MLPTITIDGRLVADPELRFTQGGKAVCSLRVAASDSKKDANGNWETGEQIFIGVTLWENEGEAAAEAFRKGDQVLVTGRIYQREFEKRDGGKGTSLEVKFPTIAKKVTAPRPDSRGLPASAQPPANDPWASAAPASGGSAWANDDQPPF